MFTADNPRQTENGVMVLGFHGRMIEVEEARVLRDAIKGALSQGKPNILLNLSDVWYINSAGVGELVSGFTNARNQGGELKLFNLTKKVHDLLQITKLYTVFDVKQGDEAAAVASFGPVRSALSKCVHSGQSATQG
jgi:anti-sigma B factor antagonist